MGGDNVWDKWEPDDVIALVCVVGLIMLIALGYDGRLVSAFLAANGVYIGEKNLRRYRRSKK